jgi:hypothetical protein
MGFRLVLICAAAAFLAAFTSRTESRPSAHKFAAATQGEKETRPKPRIIGFRIMRGAQEVPYAAPDEELRVTAVAVDPSNAPLTYRWRVSMEGGTFQAVSPREIRWRTGKKAKRHAIRLTVANAAGAEDESYLDIKRAGGLFSGRVLNEAGKPVEGALVRVGDKSVRTRADGHYALTVPREHGRRYVLSIEKAGYGYLSQILDRPIAGNTVKLPAGTSSQEDPSQRIQKQARVAGGNCGNTFSSRVNWASYPAERVLRRPDGSGAPLESAPPAIASALQIIENGLPCDAAFQVTIPANSLVDESGNTPAGPVTVSLAAVNTFNPTAMPGDYSVQTAQGGAYMETLGAGSISITRDGKPVNLRKGARAEIEIAVDPYQRKNGKLPREIPLLVYERKTGFWKQEGVARLDPQKAVYRATVTHFSEFNADYVKTNPSCIRFDASTLPASFKLEVTIPSTTGSVAVLREYQVDNSSSVHWHALYNLPNNTDVLLRPYVVSGTTETPLASIVANSGGPKTTPTVNAPTAPYYTECQGQATLVATPAGSGPFAAPANLNVTYPHLWDAVLHWDPVPSASHFEIQRAPGTGALIFNPVGFAPAGSTSYTIEVLPPCGLWHYRVAAVGPSGRRESLVVSVSTEVSAYVTVVESPLGYAPIPPGLYEITCPPTAGGRGIALQDRNAGGTVNAVPTYLGMPPGSASLLYPRQIVQVGTGMSNQAGALFGTLSGGGSNDFLAAFSFAGYPITAPSERQFTSFYWSSPIAQVTGMVAGNVTTGQSDMIVTNTGGVTWELNGYAPLSATEPGAWYGQVSGTLAITDLDFNIWQIGVIIDLNVPIIWDQ